MNAKETEVRKTLLAKEAAEGHLQKTVEDMQAVLKYVSAGNGTADQTGALSALQFWSLRSLVLAHPHPTE